MTTNVNTPLVGALAQALAQSKDNTTLARSTAKSVSLVVPGHRPAIGARGLSACLVPVFDADFGDRDNQEVQVDRADLIVVTQSCDLANNKVEFAALCPIFRIEQFEQANPEARKRGKWDEVRKGRVEALHLLASPTDPANNREALVVDFGLIVSLPVSYLLRHAATSPDRWRLQSPFLEHFSQAFARFFMRVGLPSAIPPYK